MLNPAWWAAHKKALAAFVTTAVTAITAVLALNVLPSNIAHDVAVGLAALAPVFAFLGVKVAPANKV